MPAAFDRIEASGARVVVDSSRLPFEPVALGLVPGVEERKVLARMLAEGDPTNGLR